MRMGWVLMMPVVIVILMIILAILESKGMEKKNDTKKTKT